MYRVILIDDEPLILAGISSLICWEDHDCSIVGKATNGHTAIDLILAVLFFVKVGTAYMDYRKHGQIEWAPPVILFACLVFMLTAPLYIWGIIGI